VSTGSLDLVVGEIRPPVEVTVLGVRRPILQRAGKTERISPFGPDGKCFAAVRELDEELKPRTWRRWLAGRCRATPNIEPFTLGSEVAMGAVFCPV